MKDKIVTRFYFKNLTYYGYSLINVLNLLSYVWDLRWIARKGGKTKIREIKVLGF